jgi:hypothetical protein
VRWFRLPGLLPSCLPSTRTKQTTYRLYLTTITNVLSYAGRLGARTLSKLPKAMRLRRAVPKTPAKISVSPGLPLNNYRSLLTRSESTLPQPFIPLYFISFSCNVYRKPGEGADHPSPKVLQLVTSPSPLPRARTNVRNPNPLIPLRPKSRTPRGWGISLWDSQSWLSSLAVSRGSPVPNHRPRSTGHGPRVTGHGPLVPGYRCAATRKVPESRQLLML